MGKFAELPWDIERTIENLTEVKEILQQTVIVKNLHGRGEKDAEEVAFDFDRAIHALMKQVAKKPGYEGDGYSVGEIVLDTWICPGCEMHYEVEYDDYDFCPNCGQKIDWAKDGII